MLKIISFIAMSFIFSGYSGFCQMPEDSLKLLCIKEFESEEKIDSDYAIHNVNMPFYSSEKFERKLKFYSINELFKGYYQGVKIYVVNYKSDEFWYDGRNFYLKFYVCDIGNKKIVKFYDIGKFYNFVNSSLRYISPVDKAYLCLALYWNIAQKYDIRIIQQTRYNEIVKRNSSESDEELILKDWDIGGRDLTPRSTVSVLQRENDIRSSNNDSITMYAFKLLPRRDPTINDITYRFKFMFNDQNILINTKIDTL